MTPRFLAWETILMVILLTGKQKRNRCKRKKGGMFKLSCSLDNGYALVLNS